MAVRKVVLRLVLVFSLGALAAAVGAHALSADFMFVPTDGTFRDAAALSRFERAELLVERISCMGTDDATFLRTQLRELRPELQALGLQVDNTQAPVAEWRVPRLSPASELASWGQTTPQDWWRSRVSSVSAFWTDPSSPAAGLAIAADVSGRPTIVPPRANRVNFLSAWAPPRPEQDFTVSSPATVLPANHRIALQPSLGLAFAYDPHPVVREPRVTVDVGRYAAALPGARPPQPRVVARLDLPPMPPSPLLRQQTTARSVETRPLSTWTSPSGWQWSGTYATSSLYTRTPLDPAAAEGRSFLRGHDALGAGSTWTHYAAVADYPLSVRYNVDFNVKFDQWTLGEASSMNGASRTFGLDRARLQDARVNLNYNVDPSLSLQGGYVYTRTSGLYSTGLDASAANLNINEDRGYPFVGFDYKFSSDARWNVNIRFYNTPLDMGGGAGSMRGPLNLTDPQVTTEFKVRF